MQSRNGSNVTPVLAMCWLDMNNNGGEMDRETLSTSVEGLLQWFTSKHTKHEHMTTKDGIKMLKFVFCFENVILLAYT